MPDDSRRGLRPLVLILVVIFVAAALKATKPVTMPLAFALFTLVLFWPLYRWLRARIPDALALVTTLLAVLSVLAVFVGAIWFAVDEVIEGAPRYEQDVQQLEERVSSFFGALSSGESQGGSGGDGERAGSESGLSLTSDRVASLARSLASSVWSVLGYLVLIIALFTLAVVEVPRWKHKLRTRFDDPVSNETLDAAEEITGQVQRFLLVQALTSVITGVLTGLFCWAFGVDFAFLWGLLALVLNFIPTLGSIVAVVPPVLFALLQYGIGWQPPVVFLGLAAIQLVLGSYVDPKLQGRYLELSAFVVLLAIVFWGWLWGIPGAFIAVPITAAAVLIARHAGAEWVPRLLTRDEPISDGSVSSESA